MIPDKKDKTGLKFSRIAPITGLTAVDVPRNNKETAVTGKRRMKNAS